MGDRVSRPDGSPADGAGDASAQAQGASATPAGRLAEGAAGGSKPPEDTPTESVILASLVAQLGQQPDRCMALADIRERLTEMNQPVLRQCAEDTEYLQKWLQNFPGLLELVGPKGEEQVRLTVGRLPAKPGGAAPAATGDAAANTTRAPTAAESCQEPQVGAEGATEGDGTVALASAANQTVADVGEDSLSPSTVQLRGLPFRATIADIKGFLGDHTAHLVTTEPAIRLLLNRDGKPSGFARVQFTSPQAAQLCREQLHRQQMGDRYVEVLACSDRAAKARNRRTTEAGGNETGGSAALPEGGAPEYIEQERVLEECREHMRTNGYQPVLLSMLGIALSPPVRNYLRRANLGLKHFLARHNEFKVDGPKGGEKVVWAGAVSGGVEAGYSLGPVQWGIPAREPATPRPPGAASGKVGHSGGYEDTPSNWGTPSLGSPKPMQLPGGLVMPDGMPPPGPGMDLGAFGAGWPYGPYMGPWGQGWAGWMPGDGMDMGADGLSKARAAADKKRGGAARETPASRSHAHLHPESHPFAHRPAGGSAEDKSAHGNDKCTENVAALRLRGLPFSVTVQDVLAFFAQHDVADRIADGANAAQLLPKANGRPSGQAVVQMRNRQDAEIARQALTNKYIGGRYIEVFVYGGEEGLYGHDPSGGGLGSEAGLGPDGVPPPWEMSAPWMPAPWAGMAPPTMPGGPLPGQGSGAAKAPEDQSAELGGDPTEAWSALFNFLYTDPSVDSSMGGAAGEGAAMNTPVPVDMPAQTPMQTLRV